LIFCSRSTILGGMSSSSWRAVAVKILRHIAILVVLGAIIGLILHHVAANAHTLNAPAGFGAGLLHGALMPLALPNLLVGDDVSIYAAENTGRLYKLGYTLGVNSCGLLFFGLFFWRVTKWRSASAT
jgi:hypothetical protein